MNSPKVVAKYISCLGILEENTSIIYSSLYDRIKSPALIKSLLLSIAQDSQRHSTLLNEIADSISDSKAKRGDCAKNFGKMWSMANYCLTEVKKEEIGTQDFSVLLSVLDDLENSLGDEYYNFVQTKTLELMFDEINQSYDMSLESIQEAFESIIKDEERHREILATLKDAIGADSSTEQDGAPKVRYQNPDSWDRSLPPATYNPTQLPWYLRNSSDPVPESRNKLTIYGSIQNIGSETANNCNLTVDFCSGDRIVQTSETSIGTISYWRGHYLKEVINCDLADSVTRIEVTREQSQSKKG